MSTLGGIADHWPIEFRCRACRHRYKEAFDHHWLYVTTCPQCGHKDPSHRAEPVASLPKKRKARRA